MDCGFRCGKITFEHIYYPIFTFNTIFYVDPLPIYIPNYTWVCEDCFKKHLDSLHKQNISQKSNEIEIIEGTQNVSKSY
jgi:hypothetical protein